MEGWVQKAKVGDRVRCVNAKGSISLREGEDYLITEIFKGKYFSPEIGGVHSAISVAEAEPNPGSFAFAASRFRPLQSRPTSIEVFTKLLNTAPAEVLEEA
jgi:hypothetical protein